MSELFTETEQDFAGYFDENAHGVKATYINSSDVSKSINVIFNNESIDFGDGDIETNQPMAYCRQLDVLDVVQGNALNISAIKDIEGNTIKAATNYNITEIQDDGTGIVILILEVNG